MARRVFLSFIAEDLQLVNLFRGQAKNENNDLEFADYSVREPFDSSNADYVRQRIRELVNGVSVVLCLIGEKTHTSKWVQWELEIGARVKKGLVGVRLHSSSKDVPPKALADNKAEVVDWDIKKIVSGIERAAKRAGY